MMIRPTSSETRDRDRRVAGSTAIALAFVLGFGVVVAAASMAGCGTAEEQTPVSESAPAMPSSGATEKIDIAFTSQPDPPKTGENTFEVTVKAPGDKPITDADVSITFYMPPMPNMPEMRNSIPLKHEADGRYRGTGNVMMGGGWDVTVVVKRGETEIGSRKLSVTAQ